MLRIGNEEKNFDLKNIIRAGGIAIVITLALLFIFSILLTYTKISENTIPTVVIIISGLSILIATSIETKRLKKNGIITGGLIGLIYIFLIYLLSSIITKNFGLNTSSIIMCMTSIILGCLGGIIGINQK